MERPLGQSLGLTVVVGTWLRHYQCRLSRSNSEACLKLRSMKTGSGVVWMAVMGEGGSLDPSRECGELLVLEFWLISRCPLNVESILLPLCRDTVRQPWSIELAVMGFAGAGVVLE